MGAVRIIDFDIWQPGYAGAIVTFCLPGTETAIDLYSDYALTVPASNPQTLDRLDKDGVSYGKLTVPLYTSQPYYWKADSNDTSGRIDPALTDLIGEDASQATVKRVNGSTSTELEDILGRFVFAEDFGAMSATDSGVTNATLTAAIAEAAANGGGEVIVPPGTWLFANLSLPANVVLRGAGRDVTDLQSTLADKVITINGDRAGLRSLTLDGVSQQVGSTGWYAVAQDEIVMDDVRVKRFDTGFHQKGGKHCRWTDFYVTNNLTAAKMHGDIDSGDTGLGDEFRHVSWHGGLVDQNINAGILLSYEDKKCEHVSFEDVGFETNTATALDINGARHVRASNCHWTGNTTNVAIADDAAVTDDNKVANILIEGGYMSGGAFTMQDTARNVLLDRVQVLDVDFTLTTPDNNLVLRDCIEDDLVTISGDTEKLLRQTVRDMAARSIGITSDATPTVGWGLQLEPGEVVYAEAKIIGNQRDGENSAEYHVSVSAERPGDQLAYDAQVANFTVGQIITGTNSGATALIVADADGGGTGTLTLREISGTFENNEQITDPLGGDALVNGTIAVQAVALKGSVNAIRAAREDVAGWDATFAVSGQELQVEVTGAASTTIDWTVDVETTRG